MTEFAHEVHGFCGAVFSGRHCRRDRRRQIAFIQNQKMVGNQEIRVSENLYLLEEPQLKSVKDAVQEVLDLYAREVLCIPQKLYVTQSWSVTYNANAGMGQRSYSHSLFSGLLYYCELPSPPAKTIFLRHDTYQQIDLAPDPDKRNIFNTPSAQIVPKQDEVFLFSSRLTHLIEPNQSSQPLRAIAFNTFLKGRLGDYRGTSELVI